jgi:deoxyadenosine/deoxycytidine kinase
MQYSKLLSNITDSTEWFFKGIESFLFPNHDTSSVVFHSDKSNWIENHTFPLLFSVEGNIGAGKSTLIETLKQKYKYRNDILFLQEPVDIWEKIKDKTTQQTILEKFYINPEKYAFSFQIMAFMTRWNILKQAIENASSECKMIVMERSLDADFHIFAKMLYEDEKMNDIEFQIYNMVSKQILESYHIYGIIWINTDVNTCIQHIQQRLREGEDKIDSTYLHKCDNYHKKWLENVDNIYRLDIQKDTEQYLTEIETFLFANVLQT